jgi:hypothetical protein
MNFIGERYRSVTHRIILLSISILFSTLAAGGVAAFAVERPNILLVVSEICRRVFDAGDAPFFLSVNYPDANRPFPVQVRGLPEQPLTADEVKPLEYSGLDAARGAGRALQACPEFVARRDESRIRIYLEQVF